VRVCGLRFLSFRNMRFTLRGYEKRVLWKILVPNLKKCLEDGENYITGSSLIRTPLKLLLRRRDRLRVGRFGFRFLARKEILLLPQSYPAFYRILTKGSFWGHKWSGVSNLPLIFHLTPSLLISININLLPSWAFTVWTGPTWLALYLKILLD
jgi:hypothetical protein